MCYYHAVFSAKISAELMLKRVQEFKFYLLICNHNSIV